MTRSRLPLLETRSRGFSLIELMVVVAIISILISLLMPALQKTRKSTRMVQCAMNQHHMYTAYGAVVNSSNRDEADFEAFGWHDKFRPYLGEEAGDVFVCPEHDLQRPFSDSYVVSDLVLEVYSGASHLYDMPLEEGTWTLRIDSNSTAAEHAVPNEDVTAAELSWLNPNRWYFFFEDIRPTGGDQDFRDVVLRLEEAENGQLTIEYYQDRAGYTFNLATKDGEIIWENMDAGGSSTPGSTGGNFELALGSYGLNSFVDEFDRYDANRVLMMDYNQSVANVYSGGDDWTQWHDDENVPNFFRHDGKTANVLYRDGSVQQVLPPEVDPDVPGNVATKWDPNP